MEYSTDQDRVEIRARVTAATKAAVEQAARRNDRSQVAEAGKWLEHYAEIHQLGDTKDD